MTLAPVRKIAAIALATFYIVIAFANFFAPFLPMAVIPFHVYMTVAVVLLVSPLSENGPFSEKLAFVVDIVLVVVCLLLAAHYWNDSLRLQTRMQYVDDVFLRDLVALFAGLVVLLEAVRRQVGWSLLSVVCVFLAYGFFGEHLPSVLSFSGFSLDELAEILSLQTVGIFDVPAQVGLDIIVFFVVFGSVFSMTGGGSVFMDIAFRLVGNFNGGAAKSAIVGSAMFGTVSGSAVANVTTTGVLTIPLMTRSGMKADQAAATEAVSSTGGQLMPPIMGTSAFVMAQILGLPYSEIAMAGLIPAICFYFALFMNIDLMARKSGLARVTDVQTEPLMPRLHLLASPVALTILLFMGYSAKFSAVLAIAVALLAPMLRSNTRFSLRDLINIVPSSGIQAARIAVSCTAVGIVMGVAVQSSLVLRFVSFLSLAGGDYLYLSLAMVIIGCLIMGMGMPTVAAYIVGAVLFVPAMTSLGMTPLAAHFFIFYFCVLSMVTPPVALASYAAAGLAKSNVLKTSGTAFGYGLVMFILPFGFVADNAVLWRGSYLGIGIAACGMLLAAFFWAVFLQSWLFKKLSIVERVMFGILSFSIIIVPSHNLVWWGIVAAGVAMCVWCFLSASNKEGNPAINQKSA
ncbi:TRAP transporter fused permease subunit [uncultured Cohaesibacter sp.]|uniref:TRAP transporter permease n=1 Tax=uncultured Cohaesibacter sp. TaxID=1002546 RepID=UPI0029C676A1|nr:TRAP transporter fused permease subunit [uncultured Cohaesibacter sp.]